MIAKAVIQPWDNEPVRSYNRDVKAAKADAPRCPVSWWLEPMTRDQFMQTAQERVEPMRVRGIRYWPEIFA